MLPRDLIIELKNSPRHSHHYQGGILWATFRPLPVNCIRQFHIYKLHQTKAKPTSQYDTQVVYPDCLDLFWACYNPQKQTMISPQTLLIETTTGATKQGSWTVETFRLPIIWKTSLTTSLTWTKPIKKICLLSAFTCRQENYQIPFPLPLTQCCLLGHEQFPGKHHFPHQHCIRGRGGGRSNCGRIMKGETVSEWFFACLCSAVIA